MDPNIHQPSAAEWNLDIQRAVTNSLTIDVAYVGDHGYDIENMIDLNQPALGTGWNTPSAALGGLTPAAFCLASSPSYANCSSQQDGRRRCAGECDRRRKVLQHFPVP